MNGSLSFILAGEQNLQYANLILLVLESGRDQEDLKVPCTTW